MMISPGTVMNNRTEWSGTTLACGPTDRCSNGQLGDRERFHLIPKMEPSLITLGFISLASRDTTTMALTIICVCGTSSTGKSRTIRVFTERYLRYRKEKGDVRGVLSP